MGPEDRGKQRRPGDRDNSSDPGLWIKTRCCLRCRHAQNSKLINAAALRAHGARFHFSMFGKIVHMLWPRPPVSKSQISGSRKALT